MPTFFTLSLAHLSHILLLISNTLLFLLKRVQKIWKCYFQSMSISCLNEWVSKKRYVWKCEFELLKCENIMRFFTEFIYIFSLISFIYMKFFCQFSRKQYRKRREKYESEKEEEEWKFPFILFLPKLTSIILFPYVEARVEKFILFYRYINFKLIQVLLLNQRLSEKIYICDII